MSVELRVLSGARSGRRQSFDKPVITIGRDPSSDLRLDATEDLDVSSRHAEIRSAEGRHTIHDQNSTNGTFLNSERVSAGGSRELRDGDVVSLGVHGPRLSFHSPAAHAGQGSVKPNRAMGFGAAGEPRP